MLETLRSTQPSPGVNTPAPTATSIDLKERMVAAETDRLNALEAKYAAALHASIAGDQQAVEQLIIVARALDIGVEQIGRDKESLFNVAHIQRIIAEWTPADEAEFERQSVAIRECGSEKDAIRKWKEQRLDLMRKRESLLNRRNRMKTCRTELERMQQDQRVRMLLQMKAEAEA